MWFVIRLVVRFQSDFTDSYARRNVELEAEAELLRRELHLSERGNVNARIELGAARAKLRAHGISWTRADWDEQPASGKDERDERSAS